MKRHGAAGVYRIRGGGNFNIGDDEMAEEVEPVIEVRVSAGLTVNMGNYQSLKIDVGVGVKQEGSLDEDVDALHDRIRDKVQSLLDNDAAMLIEQAAAVLDKKQ